MKNKNVFQFKNLKKQENLIHGVFGKDFGNLSLEYGSKKEVLDNKKRIASSLNINWRQIYSVKQVHGSIVRVLDSKSFRVLENNIIPETDGLITDQKNTFLMIKTADCFPVLMFDPRKKVAAAVHVGWRGAIEKIFLTALLKMINNFNSQAKDILVGIGPGIGPCCFKHKKLIQEKLPEWKKYIKNEKDDWKSVNMSEFIKDQLIEIGVRKENIELTKICTCCSKNYFSHFCSLQSKRKQNNGKEGRFATIIGIKDIDIKG